MSTTCLSCLSTAQQQVTQDKDEERQKSPRTCKTGLRSTTLLQISRHHTTMYVSSYYYICILSQEKYKERQKSPRSCKPCKNTDTDSTAVPPEQDPPPVRDPPLCAPEEGGSPFATESGIRSQKDTCSQIRDIKRNNAETPLPSTAWANMRSSVQVDALAPRCVYVCMHACMYVNIYVCMYVSIYLYACMCVCTQYKSTRWL